MGRVFHGLLRGGGQRRDLFCFVAGAAEKIPLHGNPFFTGQILQRLVQSVLVLNGGAQCSLSGLSAQILQQLQNRGSVRIPQGLFLPAPVIGQANLIFRLIPEPGREHRPHGIIKGTEIPFPDKSGHPQHIRRQRRFRIQTLLYGFQIWWIPRLHAEHHALGAAVAPSERHRHPLTGFQAHFVRDLIGIGLINGKCSRRNRQFCNHSAHSQHYFLYSSLMVAVSLPSATS